MKSYLKPTTRIDELYCRYSGQNREQPVRLCLDLETGEVCAYYWANIGNGESYRAFKGLDIEWGIPTLKPDSLENIFDELRESFDFILENLDEDDKMNEDAWNKYYDIEAILGTYRFEDFEIFNPWNVEDFFANESYLETAENLGIYADTSDDRLEDITSDFMDYSDCDFIFDELYEYFQGVRNNIANKDS